VTDGILVVGIGNPLRTDDGIGWRAAEALATDPRLLTTAIVTSHQLLPEHAFDVGQARLVVIIDARVGQPAGSIVVEEVEPAASGGTAWSHHLGPASLAALARELYGRVPPIFTVGVGVVSMEVGERLTGELERAIPGVVDTVAGIIAAAGSATPPAEAGHA
jgi:hydrogenase maturation protease